MQALGYTCTCPVFIVCGVCVVITYMEEHVWCMCGVRVVHVVVYVHVVVMGT